MYDIIVIGAGTAGLTASIYGRRANKNVLVLEALSYGGQIINTLSIENYPVEENISGMEFATRIYNQAKNLGAEIKFEKVVELKKENNVFIVKTTKNSYEAKTVVIATGNKSRKLNIDKEDSLLGKGISYCGTCDGAFFKGKDVAVLGNGNTAVEDALYLAGLANKVYLVSRNSALNAEEVEVEELKKKSNVEIIFNSSVSKIIGEEKLEGIEIVNKENDSKTLNIDGLFIAIGRIPDNGIFASLADLDESGYIIAGEDCKTKTPGLFVAGDTRTKEVRQLVTATSDGAIVISEIIKYLNRDGSDKNV